MAGSKAGHNQHYSKRLREKERKEHGVPGLFMAKNFQADSQRKEKFCTIKGYPHSLAALQGGSNSRMGACKSIQSLYATNSAGEGGEWRQPRAYQRAGPGLAAVIEYLSGQCGQLDYIYFTGILEC